MNINPNRPVMSRLSKMKGFPMLSRWLPSADHAVNKAELSGYKRAQALAYECAIEAAKELQVGMTEKQIAARMLTYLQDSGVKASFHRPLAWFGERARFKGFKKETDALPSGRVLQSPDEVVVFDLAPILNGYIGDVGFAFSLAPNPALLEARHALLDLRQKIVDWFGSELKPSEIWQKVDEQLKDKGYENCHAKYAFHVLGHRVHKVPLSWLPSPAALYSLHGYWSLASRGFFSEVLSPWHEGDKLGLWAIEPHIGKRELGFGAKFEEILVVEPGQAHWLSDDVPHVKLPAGLY